MAEPLLVLADIHLGTTKPGLTWALGAVERGAAAGARHLIILGDLIDRDATAEAYHDVDTFVASAQEPFETVVFIAGNHDVEHDLDQVIPAGVIRASIHPQTIRIGDWALHTASVQVDRDPRHLVPDFPPVIPEAPNLGLLHSSVIGDYSKHECLPCTVEELRERGYGAWLFGHVHQRISLDDAPFMGWVGLGRGYIATADGETITLSDLDV